MLESVRQTLERGFVKESQSYIKYLIFSQKARQEAGSTANDEQKNTLLEASALFRQLADDEFKHAFFYLNALGEIDATTQHLTLAVQAEENDFADYTMSAAAAQTEGMDEISRHFLRIAADEKQHAQLCTTLLSRLQNQWLSDRLKQIDIQLPE